MKLKKRQWAAAAAVCGLVAVLLVAGCAPKTGGAPTDAGAKQETTENLATTGLGMADFTDRNTGLFPDIQDNATYQNTGNRGCNSCHDDLWETTYNVKSGEFAHILNKTGYGKKGTVYDCISCHHDTVGTAGFVFSDLIHTSHYSNQSFLDLNGNCWSCHAVTEPAVHGEGEFNIGNVMSEVDGAYGAGEAELVLFEDLMYSAALGGYPYLAVEPGSIWWMTVRGWDTGYTSGATVDTAPNFSVEMKQDDSLEENDFEVENFGRVDENDVYNNTEWLADWKLEVEGVANPAALTLDDIKAMPATEVTYGHWCVIQGTNGALVVNKPLKGVLLKDFIDELGGLESDAINAMTLTTVDGWRGGPNTDGYSVQALIDDGAILAYENWGHEMTGSQGAPLMLVIPTVGGAPCAKMLDSITFTTQDHPLAPNEITRAAWYIYQMNSTWFANDGLQGRVGEELSIPCAAYGSYGTFFKDTELAKVEFSFDYGATWQSVDVPADYDPYKVLFYDFKWTPKEAGTYVLKSRAVSVDGLTQKTESSLIVTITE